MPAWRIAKSCRPARTAFSEACAPARGHAHLHAPSLWLSWPAALERGALGGPKLCGDVVARLLRLAAPFRAAAHRTAGRGEQAKRRKLEVRGRRPASRRERRPDEPRRETRRRNRFAARRQFPPAGSPAGTPAGRARTLAAPLARRRFRVCYNEPAHRAAQSARS